MSSLIVDKVDMHLALDLQAELVGIGSLLGPRIFKTIITTQFKGGESGDEGEQQVKKAFMGEQKALIIQLNEDHRVKSRFERLEHYYIQC
jgi:hypothetical protein